MIIFNSENLQLIKHRCFDNFSSY